jgi:Ca-activated chloride channel family protein
MHSTPVPTVILTPATQAAPTNGGTLDVLVRVQAPDRPTGDAAPQRQPLRLAIVIDRSGSMAGRPLKEAIRCAEYIAAGLKPTDQIGVVTYDNEVDLPIPLRPGGKGHHVRAGLSTVESGGTTALFDGWQAGATLLEGRTANTLSRVLLLSDGQANQGLCDAAEIQKHCQQWAAKGISTTTVGLGNSFNEDLMIGMAQAGGGQHYYGQSAEDLRDSFDEELMLLQALYLRQLRVKLTPAAGVLPEVLGTVQRNADGTYPLPDLAWASEAWLLVRLHIAPMPTAYPEQLHALLAVTVDADAHEGAAPVQLNAMLSLPLVQASDLAGMPKDDLVARRLKEVEFAAATARIQALAAQGDIPGARAALQRLEAHVADHPWLADKVARLRKLTDEDAAMAVKEMRYASGRSSGRLVAKSETLYMASETDNDAIPAYLRRKASEGQGRKNNS